MNLSPEKLFLVGILALVVLGPNRLPQAARTVGRLLADFRRVSASLQGEVNQALAEPREVMQKSMGEFGLPDVRALTDVRSQVRSTITDVIAGPSAGAPTNQTNGSNGTVQAPIVDPSRPLETGQAPSPTSGARAVPLPPDDPSLN